MYKRTIKKPAAQTKETNDEIPHKQLDVAAGHARQFIAHNGTTASDLLYHAETRCELVQFPKLSKQTLPQPYPSP